LPSETVLQYLEGLTFPVRKNVLVYNVRQKGAPQRHGRRLAIAAEKRVRQSAGSDRRLSHPGV